MLNSRLVYTRTLTFSSTLVLLLLIVYGAVGRRFALDSPIVPLPVSIASRLVGDWKKRVFIFKVTLIRTLGFFKVASSYTAKKIPTRIK